MSLVRFHNYKILHRYQNIDRAAHCRVFEKNKKERIKCLTGPKPKSDDIDINGFLRAVNN